MLTLYFAPGSSSMAAHIALHEVGVGFEAKPVVLGKDTLHPAFLAMHPAGQGPTLLIDDRPLTEVAGILFYLGRRFPQAGLLPVDDPEAEAQVVSWMSFAASQLHPARRQGLEAARAVYKVADGKLAGRDWATGSYTIADIHLFRLFWRFNASLGAAPAMFPRLLAHHDRMLDREAVRRTIATEAAIGYELPA